MNHTHLASTHLNMGALIMGGRRRILWEVRDGIGFLIEVQDNARPSLSGKDNARPSHSGKGNSRSASSGKENKDAEGDKGERREVTVKKLQVSDNHLAHPEKGALLWESKLFLTGANDLELLRDAIDAVKLKKETSDAVFSKLGDL